jgi:hypothetical protein
MTTAPAALTRSGIGSAGSDDEFKGRRPSADLPGRRHQDMGYVSLGG